jgi:hypothetical protein
MIKMYIIKYVFSDETTENYVVDLNKVNNKKIKDFLLKASKEENGLEDKDVLIADWLNKSSTKFEKFPCFIDDEIIVWEE